MNLKLNVELGKDYKSLSQKARVITEKNGYLKFIKAH